MTPEQRHDLVTQVIEAQLQLGLYLTRISISPWLLERDVLLVLYNNLVEINRRIYLEFDWPSPRAELWRNG